MYQPDYENFIQLLDAQAKLFGHEKLDDGLSKSYWNALKDLPLVVVQGCAANHAKRGRFFPKPYELRPREDKPKTEETAGQRADFEHATRENIANWEQLRLSNSAQWERMIRTAKFARAEVLNPSDLDIRARCNSHTRAMLA